MKKKKITLISPVRKPKRSLIRILAEWLRIIPDLYELEQKKIEKYVKNLEAQGHEVYWPIRDTNQNDPIGLRICMDNGLAIINADEVRVWWIGSSGSTFDFGMTFMFNLLVSPNKEVVIANPDDVKPTEGKSFNNVLWALHKQNTKGEER